jgi:hypothetical protein
MGSSRKTSGETGLLKVSATAPSGPATLPMSEAVRARRSCRAQ